MPSQFSSGGSVDHSVELAKNLGMSCDSVPIADAFEQVKAAMSPVFGDQAEDVTEENMQARIRGVFLMSLSNKSGRMLLTTGNKSELAVGYCTMYGDMCGGLAVISDLPKMQVYALSRWINREKEIIPWDTIEKPPSAELRPDQKDQDSLPPYPVLDAILEGFVEGEKSFDEIVGEGHDPEVVAKVQKLLYIAEYKRRQAAPGPKLTQKAFGLGRKYPITNGFRDEGN